MRKLSSKIIAVFLAVLMVMTSAPLAAIASTTAANSVLTALNDEIDAYRAQMNGTVYTNMLAAYNAYINAVKVYDKAAYGANDVTQADIESATNTLNTARTAMGTWTPKSGTTRPTNSSKGFNEDYSLTTINGDATTYTGERLIQGGTGNAYIDDVYAATYQQLGYVQRSVSSGTSWTASKLDLTIFIPQATIIYDGSNNFEARIGAMVYYAANGGNVFKQTNRRIGLVKVNGNDWFDFGDTWYQCANEGDSDTAIKSAVKNRYNKRDLVAAIANPSLNDKANGKGSVGAGTRKSNNGGTAERYLYIGNYLGWHIPANTAFTEDYKTYSTLPIYSLSGNDSMQDAGSANASINIQVLNYAKLVNALNATSLREKIKITEENPYLEGGLRTLLTNIQNAQNWNPNGTQSASSLASTMNGYINNLNVTPTADASYYGLLATEMKGALATSGTLGRWYNVNNKTENYTDESIQAFVTAFTYAQSIFDQNNSFEASFSYPATSVTVGSGDNAVTVSVPAATKTVNDVYADLHAATLQATQRVDVTKLTLYIEELTDALSEFQAYGFTAQEIQDITNAVNNAKYRIWGNSTLTDPDTGETYTVSNYGDEGSLPKASTSNQNKVTAQENALEPLILALSVKRNAVVTYNDVTGDQYSLARMLQDMADTTLYKPDDYINYDTLAAGINYVNNNFEEALIPTVAGVQDPSAITRGCVKAKAAELKSYIQYCKDIIDALEKTFLALDNGTIVNQGDTDTLMPKQVEDKWYLTFSRFTNVVVFRTTKDAANLNLGKVGFNFYQGNTQFATGAASDYNAVLDAVNINDQAGASGEIHKSNAASWSEATSVALSEAEQATYAGNLSIATTNNGTYSIQGIQGVKGRSDGNGGFIFGKSADGSYDTALTIAEGTCSAASGFYAFNNSTTSFSGNAYLSVPATSAVTLSRSTVPFSTDYSATGYFGHTFYWQADGASLWIAKNVYQGYYHERTENQYTQKVTTVDMSNLKELVAVVNTLDQNDYTEASWRNLKTKLAAATSNDFGSGKTYREVTTSALVSALVTRYQNLYDAWKALIPCATNIELTRPHAQAQNEGKDIGAVVKHANNAWYNKYLTNNDVTAANEYGTYTTNTWNAFKAAYEAGDVAIYGDGTNAGKYATPTYDTNGNTLVSGARDYARFVNGDGDALDIADLDALGLTINDIESIEGMSGVSLSAEQAEINQLAANIKSTYAALKRWANFAPVDAAMTALKSYFASNYNKVYTSASLKAINTAFAALTTAYYELENDAAAQHELNRSGIALYSEDDDAAIASEASRIMACLPPASSAMDIDVYTPAYIIEMAQNAASDPDAYDAAEAVTLATELAAEIYETVNIAPLNNLPVEGINFASNAEIDDELQEIMTHVNAIPYTVTINKADGTSQVLENQTYGTPISVSSTSGKAVPWTYHYVSRTVTTQKEATIAPTDTFEFVVVGNTTVNEGQPSNEESNGTTKLSIIDDLNHVVAIEYLNVGDSYTVGSNSIVINYADGSDSKELAAPTYAFYNFNGYNKSAGTTVVITADTKSQAVTAMYEPDYNSEGFALDVYIMRDGSFKKSTLSEGVGYNDKLEFNATDLRQVGTGRTAKKGFYYVNGEKKELSTAANSLALNADVYAYTVVEGSKYEAWTAGRADYLDDAFNTETPFIGSELTYFIASDTAIIVYPTQEDYEEAVSEGFVNATAHTDVKEELVLTNTKFTMNGNFYLPEGNTLVECGVLVYLGNADKEITSDQLKLDNYNTLSGAYRFKYTKSTKYRNINVSVNRGSIASGTRVRYRTFVKYSYTSGGKTVTDTIYSDIADDTL